MAEIKAIETIYNGYRFRSRLEARWAVFFDEIGIKYEYEKEGYDLGKLGWYLPDFWLPEYELFVEIKPFKEKLKYPYSDEATHKARQLFYVTNKPVIVCFGAPKDGQCILMCNDTTDGGGGEWSGEAWFVAHDWNEKTNKYSHYLLISDNNYSRVFTDGEYISLNEKYKSIRNIRDEFDCFPFPLMYEFMNLNDLEKEDVSLCFTRDAALKARQARFEHGEKG